MRLPHILRFLLCCSDLFISIWVNLDFGSLCVLLEEGDGLVAVSSESECVLKSFWDAAFRVNLFLFFDKRLVVSK